MIGAAGDLVRIVLTTVSDEETARDLASKLVDRRLAACVNLIPGIRSIYRWEGKVHDEAEVQLMIKTTSGSLEELIAALLDLHPYDTPEIVTIDPEKVVSEYAEWVVENVH